MNFDSTNTFLAAFAGILSVAITYLVFKLNHQASEKNRIEDYLNQMVNYSIEYPYLENRTFIERWAENRNSTDEALMRYDSYCIFVFNFLDRLCRYYKFDRAKIEEYLFIEEIIVSHKEWWNNPDRSFNNQNGYSETFKDFIIYYLPSTLDENTSLTG